MKIYLSSTFLDLKDFRQRVGAALRKAGYHVVMMEQYVARDELVETACQGDVAGCDVYLGFFAWRYGYIPEDDNPQSKSVTELEFCAAEKNSIPCLVFLVSEAADWPPERCDADPARILALRTRLKKRCAAYFENPSDLAVEVLASLRVLESTRRSRQLDAVQAIHEAQAFGPSYMANIQGKLEALKDEPYIEIQIGPIPWWNTRLHLIAALAEEYGKTREFVFVDAARRFVAMAPPSALRLRLEARWPFLATTYAAFRTEAPTLPSLETELWRYPMHVSAQLGREEQSGVDLITDWELQYGLALPRDGEIVDVAGKGQVFLTREILGRSTPFAVLVRDSQLEGLVDREVLARKVADQALADY